MPPSAEDYERYQATDRAEWRQWLAENHATAPGLWLVTFKASTGKPRPTYDEVVEEALCFGWIDSTSGTVDDERTRLLITPRKRGSPWSALNKKRIEQLIANGQMTAAGLAKIEAAKADGSWTLYDPIEALEVPPDLDAALNHDPAARQGFDAFSPSNKKQLLWWVASAKRSTTRADRIAQVVREAAAGRNPLNWREKTSKRATSP
jgi:uncharacterized protein YdeI (YjbR/CyaY-like superfamily)